MLEGKNVNLRIVEKEDLPFLAEWYNNLEVFGQYNPLVQFSKKEIEKARALPRLLEIGYFLVPKERGKGYCSEAVEILVDYLFLSKEIVRIQAHTDVANVASQKVLDKIGFKKEGTSRKSMFIRGEWRDLFVFSILREEWKEPKMLTKTT